MVEAELTALNQWEADERAATDFGKLPPWSHRSGSNPFAIASVGPSRAAGLLRGSSELVLLDKDARELDRKPAPSGSVGLAVVGDSILVVGEASGEIWRFRVQGEDRLERVSVHPVTGARSLRAIAARSLKQVIVSDGMSGAIRRVDLASASAAKTLDACHDPIALAVTEHYLIANCLSDHQIRIWRQAGGDKLVPLEPISHNGPLWALAADEGSGGELLIATTGIEDHPLDRSDQGSFGHIDSFAFLYAIAAGETKPQRLADVNLGERGLITPKWIALGRTADAVSITTAGYGTPTLLTLAWPRGDFASPPEAHAAPLIPGTTAMALVAGRAVFAAPLFDGWIGESGDLIAVAPADPRELESQIGELLFFTELMAPWSSSSGRKSKFTCEACHFEGYGDGRIHFTGRDDVSATSRPLRGLFNNSPHFTRALDETTTEMVNNEFRVANKLNGRSPWFGLKAVNFPWLARGGRKAPAQMSPTLLRRALMVFLRDFTHDANPAIAGRDHFDAVEARGAALFRDRCEECHRAQLDASSEKTRVPFEGWQPHIFSEQAGIVWGRSGYEKTGILPYVHERGARPPALRRLFKKWPYFTNGSAKSLEAVLSSFRFGLPDDRSAHAASEAGKKLAPRERAALRAFLELL